MNALDYMVRNALKKIQAAKIRAGARFAASALGCVTMHGELSALYIPGDYKKSGKIIDLGVLSALSVTDAGVAFMADDFTDGSTDITTFDFHDAGTGTNAENVTDTALQTPWGGARVSGTPTNPTAPQYRSVGTITFTGTFAITEHGLFSASTGPTLWDRSVFAAINVVNTDAIQFTYTLTINAGG